MAFKKENYIQCSQWIPESPWKAAIPSHRIVTDDDTLKWLKPNIMHFQFPRTFGDQRIPCLRFLSQSKKDHGKELPGGCYLLEISEDVAKELVIKKYGDYDYCLSYKWHKGSADSERIMEVDIKLDHKSQSLFKMFTDKSKLDIIQITKDQRDAQSAQHNQNVRERICKAKMEASRKGQQESRDKVAKENELIRRFNANVKQQQQEAEKAQQGESESAEEKNERCARSDENIVLVTESHFRDEHGVYWKSKARYELLAPQDKKLAGVFTTEVLKGLIPDDVHLRTVREKHYYFLDGDALYELTTNPNYLHTLEDKEPYAIYKHNKETFRLIN